MCYWNSLRLTVYCVKFVSVIALFLIGSAPLDQLFHVSLHPYHNSLILPPVILVKNILKFYFDSFYKKHFLNLFFIKYTIQFILLLNEINNPFKC
jgi:hypothetical protein